MSAECSRNADSAPVKKVTPAPEQHRGGEDPLGPGAGEPERQKGQVPPATEHVRQAAPQVVLEASGVKPEALRAYAGQRRGSDLRQCADHPQQLARHLDAL